MSGIFSGTKSPPSGASPSATASKNESLGLSPRVLTNFICALRRSFYLSNPKAEWRALAAFSESAKSIPTEILISLVVMS